MNYNPFSLKNKNILITGASSGIGMQCAIDCSKMGANVILIGRNEERLLNAYNSLEKGNHLYYIQDIKEYDKIESIIADSTSKIGKISGFIHSAGVELTLPLANMKHGNYEELFAINVISGFEFARIISKNKFFNTEGASFIFIASIMGLLGQTGKIGYCSSKGALSNGIKAMALELSMKKIRVNSINPAVVKTSMSEFLFKNLPEESEKIITEKHPLGLGETTDIANACIFLLSDASKWITGTNMIVDGGYSAK